MLPFAENAKGSIRSIMGKPMKYQTKRKLITARRFARDFIRLYSDSNLARASAALAYNLTLTFFPLIICLYSMLGNSYDKIMTVLDFAENFIAPDTIRVLSEFAAYVSSNYSTAMTLAGITFLVTSASAAVRTLQSTIGEMQGEQRYRGIADFIFSVEFSLVFVGALYFSITLMFMGKAFVNRLNALVPFVDLGRSWASMRFLLLAAIEYVIIWGVYEVSMPRHGHYDTWAGALLASVATVVVCIVYSGFLSASTRYPLVYGSLTSMILLMLWLYTCCLVIYCGAAFNIVMRNTKRKKQKLANKKETPSE